MNSSLKFLIRLCLFSFLLIGIFAGCAVVAPRSRAYLPLPKWEAQFAAKARRDVFPNAVRHNPQKFTNTLVVWTGIIRSIDLFDDERTRIARFTADHHYFDWKENSGPERFILSKRGEGQFAAAWRAEPLEDQKFVEQFAVGDMLIAYGYPSLIRSNVVGLYPTHNLRAIKPPYYETFDFGESSVDLENLIIYIPPQ
jgi:hypothetical protein